MQTVSLTAQWTAAIRALENEKGSDALFRDDLARELAQPDGFELLQRYKGGGVREFVVIRTRFFDDACAAALREEPAIRQIVMVAAGMDTRAYRLDWPQGTKVYEVDHGELLAEKTARLHQIGGPSRALRINVAADLARDWRGPLIGAGFDPSKPALWLAEGLLFFLTEEQAGEVLSTCRAMSAMGSRLVVDMASRSLLNSPFSQIFLAALRKDGVGWRFGTDAPEAWLKQQGWSVLDLREPGTADTGGRRWPYETQPREVPGVARSWLVTAVID